LLGYLFACAQRSIDSDQVAHDYLGVNASFYDGSARWITYDEVYPSTIGWYKASARNPLYNRYATAHDAGEGIMQRWAQECATVSTP